MPRVTNDVSSGLEQVHDAVEQSLLKEVAILRECQDKFRNMLEKVWCIRSHLL